MVNPFRAVSREDHDALQKRLAEATKARDDAKREASGLRVELRREIENAERLTALCARAIMSVEILRKTLVERQVGVAANRDPSLVQVVSSLPELQKKRRGFIPLQKRRRVAAKRQEAEEVRRNALPTIKAQLPDIPLTEADTMAMQDAIGELKETS
jgi:hypothetical protein